MIDAITEDFSGKRSKQEWNLQTPLEISVGEEKGIVRNRINHLQNFPYGLNTIPEVEDYRREVSRAVSTLQEETFGIKKFLPEYEMRIENHFEGDVCYIDAQYIKGQKLEAIANPNQEIILQLTEFLNRCAKMAEITKAQGRIILPDMLGGVKKPHSEFRNFVVDDVNKLFFVGYYPLVEFGTGFSAWLKRRRYGRSLEKAGQLINNECVSDAVYALGQTIG